MGNGSATDNLLPSLWSGNDYQTELEGANHEASYRCYSRWADDRRIALNVGIGARSSNGVNTWGYGIFFSRAAHFAVRHCRVAGGIDCHVAYCRWGAQDNQLYNRRYGLMGYSRLCFKQRS